VRSPFKSEAGASAHGRVSADFTFEIITLPNPGLLPITSGHSRPYTIRTFKASNRPRYDRMF
jgi:hypothetical protein